MRVTILSGTGGRFLYASGDGVDNLVRCTNGGDPTIEIRQSDDGEAMIISIKNADVRMEPRAAGIWLVVKEER